MNLIYVLSIIYIFVLFMLYKKTNKELCFLSLFIYGLGLLFCYNSCVVFILYLLKINGSMLIFSLINYFVGCLILFSILKTKQIQKYYYDKTKFFTILILMVVLFLVGYIRYDGFTAINFESGDSAIHYRHALEFSEELSILDKYNSQDDVLNYFERVMPISYVTCGILFIVFSNVKTYILFLYYNEFLLIICSLVFFITVFDILREKKKNYLFTLMLTLFYTFAFPLNNIMLGFCYLSLSIMVINMLFLILYNLRDDFKNGIIFKIINIFLITFAVFNSYYFFVPAIYLSLGIYYILLWKKDKLSFKQLILYGVITLIVPFVIGFYYYLITLFIDKGVGYVAKLINMWGYSYNNITPIYLFVAVSCYFMFKFREKKIYDYLDINICTISIYTIIFLFLYVVRLSDLYYFYKLFSVYWLIIILYFCIKIYQYKSKFYILLGIIFVMNIFVYKYNYSGFSQFVSNTNIYSWNASLFGMHRASFDADEIKILEKSIEYEDVCVSDNRFLIYGSVYKNLWYYVITDNIPIYGLVDGDYTRFNKLENAVPSLNSWDKALINHDCLIYYYENSDGKFNKNDYDILYENDKGAIIKRLK